jgi:hypothetical protein
VSAEPNGKQQRLSPEITKRDGFSHRAALAQVRTAGQKPDNGVAAHRHKMLEGLYEAFAPTGKWPLFQYISQLWDDSQFEARDVYLDLAEQGLVRPVMARTHQFQLRESTVVGVSLQGLTGLPTAAADLDCFVSAVRYVGKHAAEFRPSSPTELGRLSITSEQVCDHLEIKPGVPASTRLGTLISDEAAQLWTSFAGPDSGTWSMEVNLEWARRYRSIKTLAEFLAISYPAAAPLPTAPAPTGAELFDTGSPRPGQPRAFISYSHDDEAFVLALVQRLREHGVGVWIDWVELLPGDSLIRRIGDAIHDEDFVIAVISEHSVNSAWCEKELSLAVTHGIQSKQVKVLPVRLDGVALPSFLADTVWVEADRSDCGAVAAKLATAMERHLERRRGAAVVKTDGSLLVGTADRQLEGGIAAHATLRGDMNSFEFWYEMLKRYVQSNGTAAMASSTVIDGLSLSKWCSEQRSLYSRGKLSDECVGRLRMLPGWEWDHRDARWEYMFVLLQRFIAREKTALVPREHLEEGERLGRWVQKQRNVFKGVHGGGRLRKKQIDKLVALLGWTWERRRDKWERGYSALVAFQEREGHIKVPAGHIENSVRLDAWITRQRQHFLMGRIQRQGDHVARLESVPGWKWSESYAERWDRHYAALQKFVKREGHANVPTKHVEDDVMLGQWVRNQRQRQGWLQAHHPSRIARLEALPGWTWRRPRISEGP